nr:glycosyltransferase family 4 protein [Oceanipulchritudo coccoides]
MTNEFFPRTGGIATYSLELAKALAAHGQKIVVSCPDFPGPVPRMPFAWDRFKSRGSQDPDDLWRLQRVVKRHCRESPGAVLLLTEPAPVRSLLLFQRFFDLSRTPLWITFHGSELSQFTRNNFWRKRLLKLFPSVDRLIVNSAFTRTLLLEAFPDLKERVHIIPPAVSEEWKKAFAIPEKRSGDEIRILTVARIHPRKGQVEVVKALSSIQLKNHNLHYQVVGDARRSLWQKHLEAATSACPYPVELSGALQGEDLQRAFSNADIFVMASQPDPASIESFGIVYLEAAAAGLPVIAADVGGVREAVRDGENAILVPPGDAKALQEALILLIQDPEMRQRMGAAGKALVADCSWKANVRGLLE